MRISWTISAALAGIAALAGGARAAPANCDRVSAIDKVNALNAIQNLMGRYGHLGTLRGEGTLAELFAMKTEGVSWQTPGGPVGLAAMKARFATPDEELKPGVLHVHAVFSPVIEIAGDGKTAKGVWDSFGPSINDPDKVGGWLWGKYGVDFVKQDDGWKIWHLRFYAIFSTDYDKSPTQTAKERAARGMRGPGGGADPGTAAARAQAGGPPPGGPGGPPPGGPGAGRPGWVTPTDGWIYDGKTPPRGPAIPVAYCSFDPATSYTFTGR